MNNGLEKGKKSNSEEAITLLDKRKIYLVDQIPFGIEWCILSFKLRTFLRVEKGIPNPNSKYV